MKVTLKAHGWLKTLLESSVVVLVLPEGSLLIDCLNRLVETGPDQRLANIWDRAAGRFRVPIFVLIDEKEVQNFSLCLHEGQEISLVSPMAGG